MSRIARLLLCVVPLSLLSVPAHATDGVVLINQASVLSSGGFPYKITQPGSYRLSGNLVVTGSTDAIDIAASNVTLDLNGFAILGPNVFYPPCTTACTGIADNGSAPAAVTVRNGSLSGWTWGVTLGTCTGCSVQQLIVYNVCHAGISVGNNGVVSGNVLTGYVGSNICGPTEGSGIGAGSNSLIVGNTVQRFGPGMSQELGIAVPGIAAGENSTYIGNTVSGNLGNGINVYYNSTLVGNTVSSNGYVGIHVFCPSNFVGNTVVGNGDGNIFIQVYDPYTTGCTFFNNLAP